MADAASTESPLLGVIRWEVGRDLIARRNSYSPPIRAGGMRWRLFASRSADTQHLSVYLFQLDGDYEMQSVDVAVEYTMINHKDDEMTIIMEDENTHKADHRSWGIERFAKWNLFIDEEMGPKGFIKDNKLVIKAEFSLSNIEGSRRLRRTDVTDPNSPSYDATLVIEGEKVYVNKQILSIHSPFFRTIFYGGFTENGQDEVELKEVDRQEFIELLKVIYPPSKPITDDNVGYLVRLGDRFDIDWIVARCEQVLIASDKFTIASMLVMADRYRLLQLQDACLEQLKTSEDVKNLKNSDDFEHFSAELKAHLFHIMMDF